MGLGHVRLVMLDGVSGSPWSSDLRFEHLDSAFGAVVVVEGLSSSIVLHCSSPFCFPMV